MTDTAAAGRLEGKVALITGAAAGIGRATALLFAREGASVVLADIDGEQAEQVAEEVRSAGGEAAAVAADVSDNTSVEAMVTTATASFGGLDVAFNNAGIEGHPSPVSDGDQENWERVLEVNLTGTWLCMRHEIPAMARRGGGAIVNCSSIAGLVGFPGMAAYVASKHGVVGLTKAAALELATEGVRVNAICPGVIDTQMVRRALGEGPELDAQVAAIEPVGRMGTPDEVAATALWLCCDEAPFVTGHSLVIDGGAVAR